jgi:hypothetical protein
MFRGWRYVLATNHALWRLGIEPDKVPPAIRQSAHLHGYERGYSPHEMATAIGYFLTDGGSLGDKALSVVLDWAHKGKLRHGVLKTFQQSFKLAATTAPGTTWIERPIDGVQGPR